MTRIKLSKSTKTEKGQELIIIQQTFVNADIITDKISFFDRLTEPLKYVLNRKE